MQRRQHVKTSVSWLTSNQSQAEDVRYTLHQVHVVNGIEVRQVRPTATLVGTDSSYRSLNFNFPIATDDHTHTVQHAMHVVERLFCLLLLLSVMK